MKYSAVVLFVTACAFQGAVGEHTQALDEGGLRIVAANLTSGTRQSYDPGEGIRILQATDADVVLIQEFNYGDNSSTAIRQLVDTAFDPSFHYYRESGAQIPNGVVSRYPIVAAGEWDDPYLANRDFAWARIDVPGDRDLWAISVHLYSSSATTRNNEAASLVEHVRANVPDGDLVVVGGDLNTGWRGEITFTTLAQIVDVAGPFPVDHAGNGNTNASRARPYDHVLVDADLRAMQTATIFGASVFPDGLVVDTRVYAPIEELTPVLSSDSASYNMQHMAIVKDFSLTGAIAMPPRTIELTSPIGGERWEIGSTQTIAWSSSGVTNVVIESSIDGIAWNVIGESDTGSFDWTVPAPASETAWIRVSDAGGSETFDASALAIYGTPRVFMNEILANEIGSDATREHVELVNSGTGDARLDGWTISDAIGVRYTFGADSTLAAGRALVVIAALGLNNGGDTVTVRDASGNVVDSVTYGTSLASYDGVSMNRSADGSCDATTFVLHTRLSTSGCSPGTRIDGGAF